jgi:hypothetical protein
MNLVLRGLAGWALPPAQALHAIDLHRPLGARADAVLDAVAAELARMGTATRISGPDTLEFRVDVPGAGNRQAAMVPAGRITLDLADPARARVRLELRLDPFRTYGWAFPVALGLVVQPLLTPRILGLLLLGWGVIHDRAEAVERIDSAVREGIHRAVVAACQSALPRP